MLNLHTADEIPQYNAYFDLQTFVNVVQSLQNVNA